MQSLALKAGLIFSVAIALAGCGGGYNSGAAANTVAQVTLTPASVSVVAGEVLQLSFSAVTAGGGTPSPAPTFTFNSSNTKVATVSPSGLVCGGVWDSFFITCNGNDAQGNPIGGTATITATAAGVSSGPVQATVHPVVNSVVVDPVAGCFSIKETQQFTAHACSTAVLPHDTSGPCAPGGHEITSQVGPFNWIGTVAGVATLDANGVATAAIPGVTGVIAVAGSVASAPVNFRTCMPIEIRLHVNGDPPGHPTESLTLAVAGTATVQADMVDEKGATTASAPVAIVSANSEVATISGVTLTGVEPGGAALLAVCAPPACGAGLELPFYSNLFSVTVSGGSPATFVYATSSFTPPSGTSPTMLPIDTSKSPPAAGTVFNLPGTPNSLVFNKAGTTGYMGTTAGIASLNPSTNVVTLLAPFVGAVLAVSPDGNAVIFSNAVSAPDPVTGVVGPIQPDPPSQRVAVLTTTNNTLAEFVLPGAVAAAFTNDSSKAFVTTNDGSGNVYVFAPGTAQQTVNVAGTSTGVATVAAGPYAYLANSGGMQVVATCNDVQQPTANNPPTNSNPLQLVGSIGNLNTIVGVDTTGVDIETVTLNSILSTNPTLPFTYDAADCAPPVGYSNQFVDFGLGAFTARQLLVPTNGTAGLAGSHIVVLPEGINKLLGAVPGQANGGSITLAGAATEPLSGGMTPDGNTVWVGVGGTNTVDEIVLTNNADTVQIPTSFKKSDGSAAPPNIVAVQPH
jgi:trimeric autotransporter adhesin